ncbi:hypothetical protein [Candidatus Vidania fulgoroideorum]
MILKKNKIGKKIELKTKNNIYKGKISKIKKSNFKIIKKFKTKVICEIKFLTKYTKFISVKIF